MAVYIMVMFINSVSQEVVTQLVLWAFKGHFMPDSTTGSAKMWDELGASCSVQFGHSVMSDSFKPMDCSMPGFNIHHKLPEPAQKHVHPVSDVIQPSHPLSAPSPLPSIFPSIKVFSNMSVLHIWWPKCWSFSFSISPSNEYSGPISFKIDWFDILAVQGTLKSLLQHHSSKASILWHSAFFMVQLSHPCKTTGKTLALTRQTFVG